MDKIITKKEVEHRLNECFTDLLAQENFKLRKSNSLIIRKSQSKVESIFFRVLNYWPLCQEIKCVIFDIRFDKVEEVVNPFLAKYNFFNMEGAKMTSTIGDFISYNMKIDKYEDVDNFINVNKDTIKTKILDYFVRYNTMEDANILMKEQILNNDSGLYYIERTLMQSLTLMKLCNDSDFQDLSQTYMKLYSSWGGFKEKGLMAINDLIEYLSKN